MKCPMSNYVMERESGEDEVLLNDCLKEECAWWSEECKQCDPTGLLPHITALPELLERLVEKMPHEGQFRR